MTRDRILRVATWLAALYIAYVFLFYEQYKLTGHPGSVWLFQVLADWLGIGAHEKPFRLGVAIAEIIASVLVVIPATRMLGAGLSFGIISGAIFLHVVSPLGIDPYEDGGTLFKQAVGVWFASLFILYALRDQVFALMRHLGLPAPIPATAR
jgi:uncharacterized membrane protein YphA (DoxX/SURF4 family)